MAQHLKRTRGEGTEDKKVGRGHGKKSFRDTGVGPREEQKVRRQSRGGVRIERQTGGGRDEKEREEMAVSPVFERVPFSLVK